MPRLKIDFYQVVMPGVANVTFEQIIAQIISLTPEEMRNAQVKGHYIRLQEADNFYNYWEGDLIRIRMDEMPLKASLAGVVEPFILADNEGVGEETAFLYHPQTRILAIQYNRYGVSASQLARYFHEKSGILGDIALFPVIQEDAIERLARMRGIRRFEIRVAGQQNARIFRELGYGVGAVSNLINEFQAPSVSITFSMGHHRRGSLYRDAIQGTINGLLTISGNDRSQVEKIQISGRGEDGDEVRVIDLLRDRMSERVDINLDGYRRLSSAGRRAAVREAWERRSAELMRMFG